MNAPVQPTPENIALANAILRTPEVWDSQRIDGVSIEQADITPLVANGGWLFLVGPADAPIGFLIFQMAQPRIFELHTNLTQAARGKLALDAIKGAIDWLFTHTLTEAIFTHAPEWNERPISTLVIACGGQSVGSKPNAFTRDGKNYSSRICHIGLVEWATNRVWNEAFAKEGAIFHAGIHTALGELSHGDDPTHDAAVGLAVACGRGGMWGRGVDLYNRIAAVMGYQRISIEGCTAGGGFIIWMGNAILKISHDMQVLAGWNIKI